MTRSARSQAAKGQPEGNGGSSESDGTNSEKQEQPECLLKVKKLMGMYSTPVRKGTSSSTASGFRTPASTSRPKMGPPKTFSQTPRSALRPTNTESAVNGRGGIPSVKELDPVEVYCRIKPLTTESGCIRILNDQTVALVPPDNLHNAWKQGTAKEGHYSFKQVYDEAVSQKAIFDSIALPLVDDFLNGKNALLFAYGVTGSGKTYTMSGNENDIGIMPRCLDVIFNSISKFKAAKYVFKPDRMNGFESQSKTDAMCDRQKEYSERMRETARTPKSTKYGKTNGGETDNSGRIRDDTTIPLKTTDSLYSVFVTYIEIYNNFVYDLLDESPIEMVKFGNKGQIQSKMLREDMYKNVYVNQVTEVEVESPSDAFDVFQRGLRRRRMAHTALNTESSRSHSIFNIRLVQAPLDSEGEEVTENKDRIQVSQLSLVDLAGSERYTRTGATGDRLKEAGNINSSLMILRRCMDTMRENQQYGANKMVPYRESKLTHFLKNYFEAEGRVRMILCINPRNEDYEENIHVFTFAELTQEVQIQRPQEKKSAEFATPGRLKANELFKEAKRQLVEDGRIEEHDLPSTDTQYVFSLGFSPLPLCKLTSHLEADLLANLKKALEMRVKGQAELSKFIIEQREAFRRRLVNIERELESCRYENSSLKMQIEQYNKEKSRNENVLREVMNEKSESDARYIEQQNHMREMEDELMTLRMELRQRDVVHMKEKQNMKSDLDLKRELDELKYTRELQHKEKKMKAQFKEKEKVLDMVRQAVSQVDVGGLRRSSRRSRSFGRVDESLSSTSSEPDLAAASKIAARSSRSNRAPSVPLLPAFETPGPLRRSGVPSSRRPRARSTDQDIWIEHTAGIASKGGTVFQPCMKKKKSVSKLTKAEDFPSNVSKYCLRTEEQDSAGEVETKLYKGDVMQTIGGGTQVVFNDVEILRQESPTGTGFSPTRKRRSSGLLGGILGVSPYCNTNKSFLADDNPEDITERCATGIVHNSANKRTRQH